MSFYCFWLSVEIAKQNGRRAKPEHSANIVWSFPGENYCFIFEVKLSIQMKVMLFPMLFLLHKLNRHPRTTSSQEQCEIMWKVFNKKSL